MRVSLLCVRRFSTEGTIEKILTKNSVAKDGTSIFERINLVERISKMSPLKKKLLGVYAALGACSFVAGVYNDGRSAVMKNWKSRHYPTDWEAAKHGCNANVWGHFIEGLFFPFHSVSNILPYIVTWTTGEQPGKINI